MEYCSSSALLHLSHQLLWCTYFVHVYIMMNIIKPASLIKQGLCRFISENNESLLTLHMVTWGLPAHWAKLWLPFDPAYTPCYKTLGGLLPRIKAPKRVCCKAQLKHRYPALISFGGDLLNEQSLDYSLDPACMPLIKCYLGALCSMDKSFYDPCNRLKI